MVGSSMDSDNSFSGHVGGVLVMLEVVGVVVLVGVLLREVRDLLHAVKYAKKLSVIFRNRVLFFFNFFARTLSYEL